MTNRETKDVILIGAGIMSATLGSLLKELAPDWNIKVFEKLDKTGGESSNVWNNAGTGHAALCELNYTKEQSDGSIDISKAIKINEQFQITKQYWSYLLNKGYIHNPEEFVRSLPHMSLVHGRDNINFLKKRHETMTAHPLFKGMEFSEDPEKLKEW
ncbi:MAG: malate:quinone oxidoreductase, partial [Halobacillus sp.]